MPNGGKMMMMDATLPAENQWMFSPETANVTPSCAVNGVQINSVGGAAPGNSHEAVKVEKQDGETVSRLVSVVLFFASYLHQCFVLFLVNVFF